jgi:hypothetical protein
MNTLILQTLEFVEAERKATVLLQRGDKMFIGLVIKRIRGAKQYHCVYVGLNRSQYKDLIKDHAFADRASFLGISSGSIDCKKLLCDKLLLEQPTHYAGEVTPEGFPLGLCLQTLADEVMSQLETSNAG